MNRRTFLGKSMAGMCAGFNARSVAGKSNDAEKRSRIAVSSYCFYRFFENKQTAAEGEALDLLRFPEMIADRFHLHNLEILAPHFASTEPSYLKEVNAKLARAHSRIVNIPLDIRGLSNEGGMSALSPTVREHAISLFKPWFDVAQTVGARSVRCDPGKIDIENLAPTIESYQKLGGYAKLRNIAVIVENHGGLGSEHPEELVRILNAAGGNVGSLPDFGNFPDQATRDRGLRLLFPLARTICHTRDTEGDGHGNLLHFDLSHCVAIAKEAGFKGYYSIEAEANGDVPSNVQHVYDELMKSI